jgi:malonate transporter and related proteins
MNFDHPVISSLLPVVFLILVGFVAGRAKLVRQEAVRDLSNLVFLVLTQALLFRTMSSVHLEKLDMRPVFQYFVVAGGLFFVMLMVYGRDSRASVLALASIFSNTLMIGVPLIGLAYGESGQVLLFTLISLHALVLLTMATLVLELQVAHEQASATGEPRHMVKTVGMAIKNAVLHPVPLPILIGLMYAQTGLGLHPIVDKPLQLLGASFGPVALVLVGITLSQTPIGDNFRGALKISVVKTFVHPFLMAAAGYALGMRGLPLAVMVVAAALPIGANVFLFSQRYQKEEDVVTAAVAVSTVFAMISISLVMALLPLLPA